MKTSLLSRKVNVFYLFLSILLIICTFSWVAGSNYRNAVAQAAYQGYITDYLSETKSSTGQWPCNLDNMPLHLKKELADETAYYVKERLQMVLDYHYSNYKDMKILRSDRKNCFFNLELSDESISLHSELKP